LREFNTFQKFRNIYWDLLQRQHLQKLGN
jgi:hypothetical protein